MSSEHSHYDSVSQKPKSMALLLPKVNQSWILPWTCPCLHHHPFAYQDSKSYNYLWLLSTSFSLLSRQAAYYIKSSFILAIRSPYSCPFPLRLQKPGTHDSSASSFFLLLIHLSDELEQRRQVIEDGNFRCQERKLGVGNSWEADYTDWTNLGEAWCPKSSELFQSMWISHRMWKGVTRHSI